MRRISWDALKHILDLTEVRDTRDLPDKVSPVRHTSHSVHIATALLEAERPVGLAIVASQLVDVVFIHGAISSTSVYCIAIRTPAGSGTPGRCAGIG